MTKTAKPRILRDKTTRECFLIVAGSAYPVDCSDLARTIGSGRWGDGDGLANAWADAAWAAILAHLGLPYSSAARKAAQWVVKRFVQKLWMAAFEPVADDAALARMAARDEAACAKYLAEFGAIADGAVDAFKAAGGRVSTREKSHAVAYAPTSELAKQKVKGQARTLLAFFKKTRFAPATTAQAADGMVEAGLKTSTKPARIAAFYLCDWTKRGWLARRAHFA